MPKRQILRVKDKSDTYYTKIDKIFDLPFRLLINGKSQLSGKTTIILNLLLRNAYYRDKFEGENIFIVSNNKLDNKLKILMEQKDIPKENFMKYDEDELEILYDQLEEEFLEEVNDKKKPSNRLIIFDDVAYSGSLKNKSVGMVSKIVMNGRHLCLSSIFTTQKFSLVSTAVRTNITGAILFNTSQKELEMIADDFNYLPKKQDFIKMFREATKEKNSFLVVNFSNKNEEMYLDSTFEPIKQ
tara:strand:+ start:19205 stop:19930 length:726 start_codon:yes stop_codon:yes gene_type:complete